MQLFSTLVAAVLSAKLSRGAVVTQVDYVTQYNYEDVNVLVDNNGVPYSTVTSTVSTGGAPGAPSPGAPSAAGATVTTQIAAAAVTPAASAPSAASSSSSETPAAPAAPAGSHSHVPVENYQYVTATGSPTPAAPTTSSAPAPSPSTSSSSSSSSLTTSTWVPPTTTAATTSAAPATTSAASGGGSFTGDATFYEVGLGACGVQNTDSQLIAALNVDQFDQFGSMSNGNPACGKKAELHYQGKSVTVTIQDKCMGCKYGDLDLSPAAFSQLADESVGRFQMTWSFV